MLSINIIKKINYVHELENAITKFHENIAAVEYHVFIDDADRVWNEYLVVKYKGGAVSYRSCRGDSCSAIFEELSKLLDHGYWAEEADYKRAYHDQTNILKTYENFLN